MTANYVQRFAHLNANKNRRHWTAETTHRAPHKPLLLLAVIDRFAQGSIHAILIQGGLSSVQPIAIHGDLGAMLTLVTIVGIGDKIVQSVLWPIPGERAGLPPRCFGDLGY